MLGSTAPHRSSLGYSMIRRVPLTTVLLGVGITTMLVAGCGGPASTPTSSQSSSYAPTISAGPSGTASGSAANSSPTVTASPGQTYPLAHVNATLEDQLPSVIGGVALTKWSMPVSSYIASVTGGDTILYAPWLVKFGKTTDQVDMALAQDLSGHEVANLRAIQVPGASATALASGLADVATKAGWQNKTVTSLSKPVLQITDPTVDPTKTANEAFVYVKGDIAFFVISDNITIVIEALSKLPA
jgi:hypothetical protein